MATNNEVEKIKEEPGNEVKSSESALMPNDSIDTETSEAKLYKAKTLLLESLLSLDWNSESAVKELESKVTEIFLKDEVFLKACSSGEKAKALKPTDFKKYSVHDEAFLKTGSSGEKAKALKPIDFKKYSVHDETFLKTSSSGKKPKALKPIDVKKYTVEDKAIANKLIKDFNELLNAGVSFTSTPPAANKQRQHDLSEKDGKEYLHLHQIQTVTMQKPNGRLVIGEPKVFQHRLTGTYLIFGDAVDSKYYKTKKADEDSVDWLLDIPRTKVSNYCNDEHQISNEEVFNDKEQFNKIKKQIKELRDKFVKEEQEKCKAVKLLVGNEESDKDAGESPVINEPTKISDDNKIKEQQTVSFLKAPFFQRKKSGSQPNLN